MPDPAPTTEATPAPANPAQPATAAPAPASAPASAPAAPAESKPKAPAAPSTSAPEIDPQTSFELPKKDGSGFEVATLQEMSDAFLERGGPSDPEQVKKFSAFEKAVSSNDRGAMHELLDLYVPEPAKPAPAEGSGDARLAALEREQVELRQQIAGQQPIVQQIEDARIINGVTKLIETHAASIPYLAKAAGENARRVTAKIAEYRDAAKANLGLTDEQFNNHPRRQQILAAAMMDCEREIKSLAERYRDFNPPAATTATDRKPAEAGVVDDQAAAAEGHIPARYQMQDGRLVDTTGRPVAQGAHGGMATIPAQPLASEPGGAATEPQPATQPTGPYNVEQMKAAMRKRAQETSSA